MVQLEAMASGKAVVSTNLPTGVPLVNLDGKTGIVVEPASVRKLREAILRLYEDEPLRLRLGEQAYRRVHDEFTSALMCERTWKLYRRLVGGGGYSAEGVQR